MEIVIAIDSLKGSLSSVEAGNAFAAGIKRVSEVRTIVKPMADGGEGTVEALTEGLGGSLIETKAQDPFHREITAVYGYIEKEQKAIIEIAAAAGLTLMEGEKKDIYRASTYGVGQVIRDAIGRGSRDFLIGIGGSATNDCGIGMLAALGFEFYDREGKKLGFYGADCGKVERICLDNRMPELEECRFRIACDVSNPLLGKNGASYIYGPQKGGSPKQVSEMERMHQCFAKKTEEAAGKNYAEYPGAGAAGGLGFAFLSYLDAVLEPGIHTVMNAVKLEECLKNADYVITGEGRLDGQSLMGKVPVGVAQLAKKYDVPVIAVAGGISQDAGKCHDMGIDAFFSILPGAMKLEEAMEKNTAVRNITQAAEEVMRLILAVEKRKNRSTG